MNALSLVSAAHLRKAARLKEKIDKLEAELNRLLGPLNTRAQQPRPGAARPGSKRRRRMTAAGRARLSAIAKARWKKSKALGKSTL